MSWVRIDDKFPRNPKVVAAGPAAWLYVCGLCYCREHHTGGYIPEKAVSTLCVAVHPKRMAELLVKVGLWEREGEGFRVHDYKTFYEDEADKARAEHRQQMSRLNGQRGGRPRGDPNQNPNETQMVTHAQQSAGLKTITQRKPLNRTGTGSGSVREVLSSEKEKESAPRDQWLRQLEAAYPDQGKSSGYSTQVAFNELFENDERPEIEVWRELMNNLQNQKMGKQWRVKEMIPKLEKWLREGLWKQRHPAYSASDLSDATQKTMAGAAAFLHEGKRDDSR